LTSLNAQLFLRAVLRYGLGCGVGVWVLSVAPGLAYCAAQRRGGLSIVEDGLSFSLGHSRKDGPELNIWMRNLLARIDEKWGEAILAMLSDGSLRYSELSRCLPGVSQRMLTLSVRKLERDGLVDRTVTSSSPPRVVYALTEVGLSLHRRL
jgi:DNA-binding HxlR family transcriptional regulator